MDENTDPMPDPFLPELRVSDEGDQLPRLSSHRSRDYGSAPSSHDQDAQPVGDHATSQGEGTANVVDHALPARWPALEEFAQGYGFPLDPYQVDACAHVEAGSGVLVAAPTGSGKTIVGEFAVFLALRLGQKCFYTTPIKALSNQKFHDLQARHGEHNVGLLTGDTSINGEAPIVVMTTEVLRNMIYAGSRTLHNLGYVVMDEVHYLADRFRGAVWEEVIIGLAESVQLISLSATVSNAEEFGDWLNEVRGDVRLVVSERRPVPLFQHVLAGRRLYDLFAGDAPTAITNPDADLKARKDAVNPELTRLAKEESKFVRDDSRRSRGRRQRDRIEANVAKNGAKKPNLVPRRDGTIERLEREGLLPAIYFIFSRAGCDAAVGQLMTSNIVLTSQAEQRALREIAERHTASLSRDDLDALGYRAFRAAFERGIAAHHAGLLPAFKEAVEEAFVQGLVKVVFATETLALGINMPARSVVLEKLTKFNGESHADITPGEYTQLTGRAGRRGIDVEGHAVVAWHRNFDPRAVAGLASRRTYPLKSSFSPTYNMAVNLVGTVGRPRARVLLEQSFAQYQSDASVVGLARQVARLSEQAASFWERTHCEQGSFEEYATIRGEISRLEHEASKARKADRREAVVTVLTEAKHGDIWHIEGGRHEGWVVVVDPGLGNPKEGPRPMVLTSERQIKRLQPQDFPHAPTPVGRMRVPKHFNPRQPSDRRNLSAAFRSKLQSIDLTPLPSHDQMDADAAARVAQLRDELRAHPCHACPDREEHARWAEQALRAEREAASLRAASAKRTNTIATKFDKICTVLEALGYLGEGGETVTEAGRMLARIYCELDLVAAECVRAGLFDELTPAELAAVASTLIYESRGSDRAPARMPTRSSEIAATSLRQVWREVRLLERDHRLESGRLLDVGFAEPVHLWASGGDLADVLHSSELTAGDFVRWTRQVIDLLGQLADAAGASTLRTNARAAVDALRRGVVAAAYDEDD